MLPPVGPGNVPAADIAKRQRQPPQPYQHLPEQTRTAQPEQTHTAQTEQTRPAQTEQTDPAQTAQTHAAHLEQTHTAQSEASGEGICVMQTGCTTKARLMTTDLDLFGRGFR